MDQDRIVVKPMGVLTNTASDYYDIGECSAVAVTLSQIVGAPATVEVETSMDGNNWELVSALTATIGAVPGIVTTRVAALDGASSAVNLLRYVRFNYQASITDVFEVTMWVKVDGGL